MTPVPPPETAGDGGSARIPADVGLERVTFDFDADLTDPTFALLSDEERVRACRFVQHRDRIRFAATRAALRRRLGAVLGLPGPSLRFATSPTGRPALVDNVIDFNVSHSGAHALIAWSPLRRVGVDIEVRVPDWDWKPLARHVFGPADRRAIAAAVGEERRAMLFHDVWVAKEALLKAEGRGIGIALGGFSVLGEDDSPASGPAEPNLAESLRDFRFRWLRDIPGYAACLAWSALPAPIAPTTAEPP